MTSYFECRLSPVRTQCSSPPFPKDASTVLYAKDSSRPVDALVLMLLDEDVRDEEDEEEEDEEEEEETEDEEAEWINLYPT